MLSLTPEKANRKEYNILGFIIPAQDIIKVIAGIMAGYTILIGVFNLIIFLGSN